MIGVPEAVGVTVLLILGRAQLVRNKKEEKEEEEEDSKKKEQYEEHIGDEQHPRV